MKTRTVLDLARDAIFEANQWRNRQRRRQQFRDEVRQYTSPVRSQLAHEIMEQREAQRQQAREQAEATSKQGADVSPEGGPLKPKNLLNLLKQTFSEWNEDRAPQLAAALAYYTIFSMAPLLVIIIAIAGLVFGQEAAQNQIVGQIQGMVGQEGATFIQSMLQNANKPAQGVFATIVGLVTLLLGAAGVFGQMKAALNVIWNVEPEKVSGVAGVVKAIKNQLLNFGMVLGIGFLLLVSLVLSAAITAVGNIAVDAGISEGIWHIVEIVVSFGVITLLFAAIYKVLPDTEITWHDVLIGAAMTSLLFTVGKWLLGLYLGRSSVASPYGAAGSLVVLLVWIYYSAQILFLGAEFTQVYANTYGSKLTSDSAAAESAAPKSEPSRVKAHA
jgi:membrane protein